MNRELEGYSGCPEQGAEEDSSFSVCDLKAILFP